MDIFAVECRMQIEQYEWKSIKKRRNEGVKPNGDKRSCRLSWGSNEINYRKRQTMHWVTSFSSTSTAIHPLVSL